MPPIEIATEMRGLKLIVFEDGDVFLNGTHVGRLFPAEVAVLRLELEAERAADEHWFEKFQEALEEEMSALFKQAVKRDAKLRMALCGPAGSGKTYSLLSIASHLGGPIAYVDTEHGSASKYADLFQFDVIEPDVFDPRKLIEFIAEAVGSGYRVICIDSLSHYWMGTGGELDLVDSAAKKSQSGNSFAAWKNVTPIHNKLVDTIIGANIHVLVSMRTKTEWVIEENDKGKKTPRKIGLAPVMRDGIEFEFDVCGDLDQDNTLVITKSRCPELSGKVINRPGKEMALTLKHWLSSPVPANAPAPAPQIEKPIDTGGHPVNTQAAANAVAERKIREMKEAEARIAAEKARAAQPVAQPAQPFQATNDDLPPNMGGPEIVHQEKPWTTFKGMLAAFEAVKAQLGDEAIYYGELDLFGVKHANGFKSGADALKCYQGMKDRLAGRIGSVAA